MCNVVVFSDLLTLQSSNADTDAGSSVCNVVLFLRSELFSLLLQTLSLKGSIHYLSLPYGSVACQRPDARSHAASRGKRSHCSFTDQKIPLQLHRANDHMQRHKANRSHCSFTGQTDHIAVTKQQIALQLHRAKGYMQLHRVKDHMQLHRAKDHIAASQSKRSHATSLTEQNA